MPSHNNVQFVSSEAEVTERKRICTQCPYYSSGLGTCGPPVNPQKVKYELKDGIPKKKKGGKHGKTCGCFLQLKWRIEGAACPLGAWGDLETEKARIAEAKELIERIGDANRMDRKDAERLLALNALLVSKKNKRSSGCGSCIIEAREQLRKQLGI